jgi:calmodulin
MNLETLREKYIPIEKKKKFRENYNLFDRRNVEALDYDEMKEFLTSVGQMLPEDELEEFYKNLADQKGISLSNTEIIIIKKLREEDLEEQITEAFRIIDKEKLGSIESEYFKEMLMTNGYKWPEDKAD